MLRHNVTDAEIAGYVQQQLGENPQFAREARERGYGYASVPIAPKGDDPDAVISIVRVDLLSFRVYR